MQKCILAITDGIGINPSSYYNAFAAAKKPAYSKLEREALKARLATSGNAVGLPNGQIGNSEVGHMCLGSGRVIFQSLVKIDRAIASGDLEAKINALNIANSANVHVFGLYSDGGVHSMHTHFNATLKALKKLNLLGQIYAHAITDGRDVLPKIAKDFIAQNPPECELASIAGRFWAMDRDNNHERTKEYINMLTSPNLGDLDSAFSEAKTDEFLKPTKLKACKIAPKDVAIIINFRADRARQLAAALKALGLRVICMCEYDAALELEVLYAPEDVPNCLAEVISAQGLSQLHTAETEKYAHVSFFFNGGREQPFSGEKRVLIPSNGASNYATTPKMMAEQISDAAIAGIKEGIDFIVLNYANGDMVGHTGDYEAAILAVEEVDAQLMRLMQAASKHNYALLITSDHGNCEHMKDELSGEVLPNHTLYDVGLWAFNTHCARGLKDGTLANVAATVLEIMGLNKPEQMQESLIIK